MPHEDSPTLPPNPVRLASRRPTVGLQITNLAEEYPILLFNGVADRAEELDVNLIVYRGESFNPPWGHGYQFNAVYDLISEHALDALIIVTGTLCNYISTETFQAYIDKIKTIPLVSLAVPIDGAPSLLVDNRTGIRASVEHLVRVHGRKSIAFIRGPLTNAEAKIRYEAFVSAMTDEGLSVSPELVYTGNFIENSGAAAVNEFLDRRKVSFDALIASNDNMAIGAMNELLRRGFELPEQVSVIGFDNIPDGENIVPSLTTVKQPLYQIANRALDVALKRIRGERVEPQYDFPTTLYIRNSCGCVGSSKSHSDRSLGSGDSGDGETRLVERLKTTDYYSNKFEAIGPTVSMLNEFLDAKSLEADRSADLLRRFSKIVSAQSKRLVDVFFWKDVLETIERKAIADAPKSAEGNVALVRQAIDIVIEQSRSALVSARVTTHRMEVNVKNNLHDLISSLSVDELLYKTTELLPRIGIRCFYVVAYNKVITAKRGQPWPSQEKAKLLLAFDQQVGLCQVYPERAEIETARFVPDSLVDWSRRHNFMVMPLFFMEEQYGYIVFEMSFREGNVYDLLAIEISSTYRSAMLLEERQRAETKLRRVLAQMEEANSKLSNLSETDEMTGLYNRRGFLSIGEQSLQIARRMQKNGVVFFIDLDGLKTINDTYGHQFGDVAIKACAEILVKVFRKMDVLARLGGDEFTILTLNTDPETVKVIKRRLGQSIDEYNRTMNQPFTLSMSAGEAFFSYSDETSLTDLMAEADRNLYKEKRRKKKAQEKPGLSDGA